MTNEDRLASLERTVRNHRLLGLLTAVVIAASLSLGSTQSPTDLIRAKKIVAEEIVVTDATHASRTMINGAGTYVFDLTGTLLAALGIADDGQAGLVSVLTRKGQGAATLTLGKGGAGQISIFSADGKRLATLLPSQDEDGGALLLNNASGEIAVGLGVGASGTGGLVLNNKKGVELVSLGQSRDGMGRVAVFDKGGGALIGLGSRSNGEGAVIAFDRGGSPKAVWP